MPPAELESLFFSLLSCEAIPEAFEILDRLMVHAPEFRMIRDLRAMADDLDQEPAYKSLIGAMEDMYRNYGVPINSFNLFEIGERYPVRVPYSDKLTTAAQREAFLEEHRKARRTRPVLTELCRERAKYDRTIKDAHEPA
jgi:hypothetical protein